MSTTGRETIPRAILCVDVYNCHVSKVYDVIRSTIFTAQNLQCIMWLTGYIESIFRPEYPERGQLHPSDFAAARLRWRRHALSTYCWQLIDPKHYCDVIMGAVASQITSLTFVYSTIYWGTDQSSASLAFVRGIHRWPVNSRHKLPVTLKMFPFDDVIIEYGWNLFVLT